MPRVAIRRQRRLFLRLPLVFRSRRSLTIASYLVPLALVLAVTILAVPPLYHELRVWWVVSVFPPRWEPSSALPMAWVPSPYYHPRESRVDTLVIHVTEGGMEQTLNWFQRNPDEVSAHYVIGRDGRIVQLVNEQFAAHHAGEVTAPAGTRWLNGNPNEYSIGIELESDSPLRSPDDIPQPQREALWALAKDIVARHHIPIDRQHLVPHSDIDPRNRRDPGPGFPWDDLLRDLAASIS